MIDRTIVRRTLEGRLPPFPLLSENFLNKIVKTVQSKSIRSAKKYQLKGEINIIFVDNSRIRRLNKEFLSESSETDVIAFGYDSGADIFISVPVACANAVRFHESPRHELIRLVVHGLLHLSGYTDHQALLKKKMWKKQEELVQLLAYSS